MSDHDLRYPVGEHDSLAAVSPEQLAAALRDIRDLPMHAEAAVRDLSEEQLETPYRPGGWTVRQVIHHLADSHVNAYTRLRLAMTEERPTIRPYDEKSWAELGDAKHLELKPSLSILRGVHQRWSHLLDSMNPTDFDRELVHPEIGPMSLAQVAASYGWHSRHHVAHITNLRARNNW